ncbi:MAG: FAD-binding oxidoreductase [Rubrobacteraceae bacterium]
MKAWRGGDKMNYTARKELLKTLEGRFGNRCKPHRMHPGPLATVLPVDAGDVGFLAKTVRRYSVAYSVTLRPTGMGTDPDLPEPTKNAVLVSTEMMRAIRFPDDERSRVEVEPGVLWLDLEEKLRSSHRALPMYPTSAPRATVGGWIARDGVGVGSFAYGWLRESIASVEVILPDGRLRTIEDERLGFVVGALGTTGVIVRAALRLRKSRGDRLFAAEFAGAEALRLATSFLMEREVPIWHLGVMNPAMSRAIRSRGQYLAFGAYPASGGTVENELERALKKSRGTLLDAAETARIWDNRFFPVVPDRPPPAPGRVLVPVPRVGEVLDLLRSGPTEPAILGSVTRDGSVLLLAFKSSGTEGVLQSLDGGDEAGLVGIARSVGGDLYHTALKRRAKQAHRFCPQNRRYR